MDKTGLFIRKLKVEIQLSLQYLLNMRSTQSLKYIQSIKFVGGKHRIPSVIDASIKPHFGSSGILPGSEGAIKVSSLPKREPVKAAPVKIQSWGLKPSDKEYQFVSVKDLPKRFQPLKFDDLELETVNLGGADYLVV